MSGMHVETTGAGPHLVLVHGWAMHGGVFAPLVEQLAGDYTVHLVDLPGHGHSAAATLPLAPAPVVAHLVERLPRALWVGWSLGGLFALQAALAHAPAVRGVALLCSSPRFVRDGPGGGWRYGMSAEVFADFAAGLRQDWRGTLERFIALEALGSDHAQEELRSLRAGLFERGEPAAEVLADGLQLLQQADLRPALAGLPVPSLWLAGRRDRVVDPRAMREAAALAPGAQFEQVEHAGHAPFLTHPGQVAGVLRRFASTLTP